LCLRLVQARPRLRSSGIRPGWVVNGGWLAVVRVPAWVQERGISPALDVGSAAWPSLRLSIFDGAFVADRCHEWASFHGLRHQGINRGSDRTGIALLARRWLVEYSFGWLAYWGGLARDRAGRLDVSAGRLGFVALLSRVQALRKSRSVHAARR